MPALYDVKFSKCFLQLQTNNSIAMKPSRPDSAKSTVTRITLDSENSLNASKFSETFTSGSRVNNQKNKDFHKYVSEKNKDPRFKKLLETSMPAIPQQVKPSAELTKLTSKPFERKSSKTDKQKMERKPEEPGKKVEEVREEKVEQLQNSKTFIDKSKQKLKLASKHDIDQNASTQKTKAQSEAQSRLNAQPINLNGFVLNIPGKPPKVIKEEKKQQKPEAKVEETEESEEKRERNKMMSELDRYLKTSSNRRSQFERYVQEVEEQNLDCLPPRYEEFIQRSLRNSEVDFGQIDLQQFMQPNERDYQHLMTQISQNEKQIELGDRPSSRISNNSSLSIDLEEIIDGSKNYKEQEDQNRDDISVVMSSMSASDVRDRNMFLTEVFKGRRVTGEQLDQIRQNDAVIVKMVKLEATKDEEAEVEVENAEINMNKKKNNRFIERNKFEAAGELYRECDLLTPEQRQRIEDIINGAPIGSPFQQTEMQSFMSRRIDEGINLHRQLCRDIEGQENQSREPEVLIDEDTLPKEPLLRKNAELKILRQKIDSVNSRLAELNKTVVNKAKIRNLIDRCKERIKPSKMSESLIKQKQRDIEEQCTQLRQAESILNWAEAEKEQVLVLLEEMSQRYRDMEADVLKLQKMDAEELREMEHQKLRSKMRRVEQVEDEARLFESELGDFTSLSQQIRQNMQVLDEILAVGVVEARCEGYQQGETIEDIDKIITQKWEAAEKAVGQLGNGLP